MSASPCTFTFKVDVSSAVTALESVISQLPPPPEDDGHEDDAGPVRPDEEPTT